MQWYYSKNNVQLGPVELGELVAKIASGEVLPGDLVWREGMPDWQPCGRVAELAAARPVPVVPVSQAAPPQAADAPAAAPAAYPAPQAVPPYGVGMPVPGSGKATASMVLGIVSCVFGLCSCYGGLIAISCGILAVVFASQVEKMAKVDPRLMPDLGKVKTGRITGWVGIVLCAVTTLAGVGWFISAARASQHSNFKFPH